MKKKLWLYMAIAFAIAGILLFTYAFTFDTVSAVKSATIFHQYTFEAKLKHMKYLDMVSIQSLDPDQLDQSQEQIGNDVKAYAIGPMWVCQGVKNDRSPIYGFSMILGEYHEGVPTTEPIYIGITSSLLTGSQLYDLDNWDAVGYMNPGTLPEIGVFYWVTYELNTPLNIPAGQTFYIIAISEDQSYGDVNWWQWATAGDLGDVYPRGSNYVYNGESWDDSWRDMCFRTYTTPNGGNGDGEPLQITITSNYQVAAQFIGSLSLLGAVVSGTKYFMGVR